MGLTVNRSNNPTSSFPAPPCATTTPGYHVVATNGVQVFDALNNANPKIDLPATTGPVFGFGFAADPQILPGASTCPSSGAPLSVGWTRPFFTGSSSTPMQVALSGAPPLASVALWVDLCPVPGGIPLPAGDVLHLNPFSPSLGQAGLTTNAAGVATLDLGPLSVAPPGLQITLQFLHIDPAAAPLGVCLSDGLTITTSLP